MADMLEMMEMIVDTDDINNWRRRICVSDPSGRDKVKSE